MSGPGRSGGDEPGFEAIGGCVHKQRALNILQSSGTSARTFAVSAGPYRNYRVTAGTKNKPYTFFVPLQKKGWKIDPRVSNLRSREFRFQGVQVHPSIAICIPTLTSYLNFLKCQLDGPCKYGVATIRRLLKMTGLLSRISSVL